VYGLDSSGSGLGPVAVSCKYSDETLCSIKDSEFFDQLIDY
jgi:hypothetical protein